MLGEHDQSLSEVDWSADGQVVASDHGGLVQSWSATAGRKLTALRSPSGVWSMRVSPDGRWIAAGSEDGVVRLGTLDSEQWRHELHGHGDNGYARVTSVAWSSNSKRLLSGSMAGTALMWNPDQGKLVRSYEHRVAMPIYSVALAPDGGTFAIAMANDHLLIWDVESDKPKLDLAKDLRSPNFRAVLALGGEVIATTPSPELKRWDSTGAPLGALHGHQGLVDSLRVSTGNLLATGSTQDGTVRLWSLRDRRELLALMTLIGDEGGYARSPEGDLALLGTASQQETLARFLPCRVGTFLLPFEFCRDRFLEPELIPETMREFRSQAVRRPASTIKAARTAPIPRMSQGPLTK